MQCSVNAVPRSATTFLCCTMVAGYDERENRCCDLSYFGKGNFARARFVPFPGAEFPNGMERTAMIQRDDRIEVTEMLELRRRQAEVAMKNFKELCDLVEAAFNEEARKFT